MLQIMNSIGNLGMNPFINKVIQHFGWRWTFQMFTGVLFCSFLILIGAFREPPGTTHSTQTSKAKGKK